MARRWGFYGRETEIGRLIGEFTAPESSLVTIRGRRGIGKTTLLDRVADRMPEGRRVFQFEMEARHTPDLLWAEMRTALEEQGFGSPAGGSESPLQNVGAAIRRLLEGGTSVVLDEAQFMMSDDLVNLTWKLKALCRQMRRQSHQADGAVGKGSLVLMGSAQQQMEAMFAGNKSALSTALRTTMVLEPWPVSTILAVADRQGWMERPGRLVTLWTAFGGVPRYWEQFAHTPAADFEHWENDGVWRREFIRAVMDTLGIPHGNLGAAGTRPAQLADPRISCLGAGQRDRHRARACGPSGHHPRQPGGPSPCHVERAAYR